MIEFKRLFLKIADFEIVGFAVGNFVSIFAFVCFYNSSINAGLAVYDALLCAGEYIGFYLGLVVAVQWGSAFIRLLIRERREGQKCQEQVDDAIEECTDLMVNRYDKRP